ncbi:MAG: HDIG domain-containing protein [Chloroflexi bacterium]|nr:HDIG domain-containing protein [Chloroflexota bacterium]
MTEEIRTLMAPSQRDGETENDPPSRWTRDPSYWRARFNLVLFFIATCAAIVATQIVEWPATSNLQLQADDISQVDIRAPRTLTYQSEILTTEARQRASNAVPKVFDPPQTRVARQQIARAELIQQFIDVVRLDPYASASQKISWLGQISDLKLSPDVAKLILAIDAERWQIISSETTRVLALAMRKIIREGELPDAQRAVPSLIGFGLNDDEAKVVSVLVQGLLRPNTFFNAERTNAARAAAAAQIKPVDRTISSGEIIVRAGDRVEALDIEALDALGLLSLQRTWRDYVAALLLGLVLTSLFVSFISYRRPHLWNDNLKTLILLFIIVTFILVAKMMIPMHTVLPYLYPLAAMAMLIGALIDLPIAMMAVILIGVIIALLTDGNVELTVTPMLSALAGAMALGRAERMNSFVRAGVWLMLTNLVALLIFRLPQTGIMDDRAILELVTAVMVNAVLASSFTLVSFYLMGQLFGLTTSLQLLELSRPTHPLLRQLLLKAPGTYHHTLLVSNMAEEAATAIGADALLARVGTYYHDIGKTVRPYFFIENNIEGVNPHDRLDPYTSARIIISHVSDGVDLARKYRLPEPIIDFIREHHGTSRVEYFYHQACQEQNTLEEVDESQFRYGGPRPRSRETAILMLADASEAIVRAINPATHAEILELIHSTINRRLLSGQLDDSPITLQDLDLAAEAFARVLQGIHHPRIRYPGDPAPESLATNAYPQAQPVLNP